MEQKITLRQEWTWAFWTGVLLALITAIPYVLGFALQGQDYRFTGFVFGVEDGNSYIAKMLAGSVGDWLFRTPYTAYPQQGVLAFFPYLLLGKLAAAPGLHGQLVALFQLFRVAGCMVDVLATYYFASLFLSSTGMRRFATVLIAVGGGLGWAAILGGHLPLEFYSPESFGFLGIYGLPHLAFARAFLLIGLGRVLRPPQGPRLRKGILSSLVWIGLGLMQPLTVVIGWAILGAHRLVCWGLKAFKTRRLDLRKLHLPGELVIAALAPAPLVVYTLVNFYSDPFLQGWTSQNLILSPPPGDYLLAYALALIPAVWAAVDAFRKADPMRLLLATWLILFPFLAYAPYNLQRRLPEGVWAAIVILALLKVETWPRRARRVGLGVLASGILSTSLFFAASLGAVLAPGTPLYRPALEAEAFQYLAEHASKGAVVLAPYEPEGTSNALPAWAAVRTVIGHGPESVNLAVLGPRVRGFYQNTGETGLLDEFKVSYVLSGPIDHITWDAAAAPNFKLVYQNPSFRVYQRVNP